MNNFNSIQKYHFPASDAVEYFYCLFKSLFGDKIIEGLRHRMSAGRPGLWTVKGARKSFSYVGYVCSVRAVCLVTSLEKFWSSTEDFTSTNRI